MIKSINIGGQELLLASNGATPIRFKQIFKQDLMVAFSKINTNEIDGAESLELTEKLAFIMNKQATIKDKKEWTSISYDDFIEFTEGFEVFSLAEAAEEIEGAEQNDDDIAEILSAREAAGKPGAVRPSRS